MILLLTCTASSLHNKDPENRLSELRVGDGVKRRSLRPESDCGRRAMSQVPVTGAAVTSADMQAPTPASHVRHISPSIPLSRLIEFAVQRTYHELEVLTNL